MLLATRLPGRSVTKTGHAQRPLNPLREPALFIYRVRLKAFYAAVFVIGCWMLNVGCLLAIHRS